MPRIHELDCRRDLSLSLGAAGVEFAPKDQMEQMPRDREYALRHVRLDIAVDFEAGVVKGTATHRLQAINAGLKRVRLDAVDMRIKRARAMGKDLSLDYDGQSLDVALPRALKEGEVAELTIAYEARPRKGMFFIRPAKENPRKSSHIWTQGEMEDNRHWFPSYDYPNQRCTSEVVVDLPSGWKAVANGRLIGEEAGERGRRRWHFLQDKEHVNYLITLVAGEFEVLMDSVDGIPLEYWAPKGAKKEEIKLSFRSTPDILRFLGEATGLKYPFAKLTQAVVQDFTFGGMENTTLITLYEGTIHNERALPDYRVEGLLAHEAAHQWFGDYITCRSWGHLWLNESFATYFSPLYVERRWGKEEFQHTMMGVQASYMAEAGGSYQRPIVTLRYKHGEDMFDRHTYEKGSCVLHVLRATLGDELFFKAMRHYVRTRQNTIVETNDLKEAIEQATGKNLDWFFDQWLHRPGHPDLELGWEWDEGASAVKLKVKQRQRKDEKSETPIFRMSAEVELLYEDTKRKGGTRAERRTIGLSKPEEEILLPAKEKPKTVVFDPDFFMLARREFKKPKPELLFQLKSAPSIHARILACEGLSAHVGDDAVVKALADALEGDGFHGVRRAAAKALGDIQGADAWSALRRASGQKDPRVRRAVYEAMGRFRTKEAARHLATALRNDRADYAAAAAAAALGATRRPEALRPLLASFKRRSHFDAVKRSAIGALVALRDERAFPHLESATRPGEPTFVRAAAIESMGELADSLDKKRREVREFLEPMLRDKEMRIRGAVAHALVEMGEIESVGLLRRLDADLVGRVRRQAERGARVISEKAAEKAQRKDFGAQVEEMRKEALEMKKRLERLEARFEAKGKRGRVKRK
jgi:aminopeptidase N